MTAPLRAGIIGLGVGEKHITGYEADRRCQVVALCDADADKLKSVGERHPGRRLVSNPDELLSDPSIDVVSIASYDGAHYAQVMSALAAGKHVFVEKPVCLFEHELADIRRALVANPNLKLSSNLILRKSPRFVSLRQRVQAGKLGTPYYAEADYNYGRLSKITDGWRGHADYYSVVHGGAIHMLDLLFWVFGERPVAVTAFGNSVATRGTSFRFRDCVTSLLKFPSGLMAKVTANFGCVLPHHHNLTVYGTAATFVHDQLGARLYTSRDPASAAHVVDDAYLGPAKGDMLPSFVSAILDGSEPDVSAADVLDTMTVSLAIEKAAELEQTVRISMSRHLT
ncbi:MAG TPA: Gfo/Idh/MocA family oxidoreductase [Candidatus Acidoferrales bacterium]|nr:Gfo/Idh/MocA family oxidoreductase [Candidatus Acidoferrales bacterium]